MSTVNLAQMRRVLATGGVNQQFPVDTSGIETDVSLLQGQFAVISGDITSLTLTNVSQTSSINALIEKIQHWSTGTAAPGSGAHVLGEIVWNTAPTAGGYIGFTCVTAGSPGTWKGFGLIQA